MLTLLFLWAVIALLCAGTGLALTGSAAGLFARAADRLFFALLLGLAVIGGLLLAWSLLAPVGPWALALCACLALAAACAQPAVRSSIREILTDRELRGILAAGLVLAVLFAERSTAAGDLDDAGGYHVGIVRWLSEYGTVHGMALIHDRLGFASSWLAWSAAFDHGELAARTGTVMNGFLLLLCLGQLLLVMQRIRRGRAQAPDWLALLAWLVVLPPILRWDMRTSPSPDIAIFVFGIAIPWAILVIESQEASSQAASRARFLVLLLGAGAVLMKLSSVPLLAAGGCYFVWARRDHWPARLGVACVAGAVFLGVLALAGLVSSGCAFFPWPRLCTDLPWSVGRETAQRAADVIYRFALGTLYRPDLQGAALLAVWVKSNFSSACWIALSLVAAVWLLLRRKRLDVPGLGWAAAVAAIGVPFILVTAPAGRFGMSYLVLLPLLALLTLGAPSARILSQGISNPATRRGLGIAATAVVALVVALPLYKEFVESKPRAKSYESIAHRKQGDRTVNEFNAQWWLLPNRYAELPGFSTERAHDFDYSIPPPSAPLCWHHALPCTSYKFTGVRLRDPAAGLSGGFVRVEAAGTRKDSSCARSSSRRKPWL